MMWSIVGDSGCGATAPRLTALPQRPQHHPSRSKMSECLNLSTTPAALCALRRAFASRFRSRYSGCALVQAIPHSGEQKSLGRVTTCIVNSLSHDRQVRVRSPLVGV
jgi:hypothetical protein